MKQLRRKFFWTLYAVLVILAAALSSFAVYREYVEAREEVQDTLISIANGSERYFRSAYARYESSSRKAEGAEDEFMVVSELPAWSLYMDRGSVLIMWKTFGNTDGTEDSQVAALASRIASTRQPGQMEIPDLFEGGLAWYYASVESIALVDTRPLIYDLMGQSGAILFWLILYLVVSFWVARKLVAWMIAPIEATFNKQKQFIADASHELKTPLAVIIASAEAMEGNPDPKWTHNISAEADRMNRLITDLLNLTRSEQKSLQLEKQDFSFVVEKECLIQEAVIFEKGLQLTEQIQPSLFVNGEGNMLAQVTSILLDNAVHHAATAISVRLFQEGSHGVLEVENNGEPIPDKDRERIFERFYRSDSARNRNENRYGLGLAIAKNICERLSGSISVRSDARATCFVVRLPLVQGERRRKQKKARRLFRGRLFGSRKVWKTRRKAGKKKQDAAG